MKTIGIIILLICTLGSQAFSQSNNLVSKFSSRDEIKFGMSKIVDSVKKVLSENGFSLLREANLEMENQYESPVIAALSEGSYYQVVFIADPTSRLNEVRMYDYDEKQVYYQRNYGDVQGNIINYGYLARFSEFHMIKPVQVNKSKKFMNGYLMLFKKTNVANP